MRVLRNNQIIEEYAPAPKRTSSYRMPSDTASRLLECIRMAERRGETLSIRGLRAACGISSTSVVEYHLRQMARDGDLVLGARGAARSYRLTEQGRGLPSDEDMLRRCLDYLEGQLGAVGGALVEDLRGRLS